MRVALLAFFGLFASVPAMAAAEAAFDLCAPCLIGAHCSTNYCALDANGNGLCTQACSTDDDCPAAFACSSGFCTPSTAVTCPTPYPGAVNTLCQFPPVNGDTNTFLQRTCATGLTCYLFPVDATGYSTGVCVEACSSTQESAACSFGDTCCYGTDSTGACISSVTSEVTDGGCFDVGDVGDLCADGNESYCLVGATCLYTQTPSAARCYDTCAGGLCNVGGTCQSLNGISVCCDSASYKSTDITTCVPAPGYCRRGLGVSCSTNEQCRKGLCYKAQNQAACTQPCTADADCQAADTTATTTCQPFGSDKYCWPVSTPAAAPSCANIEIDTSPLTAGSGCHCRHGGTDPIGWVAASTLAAWRRLRAKRGRRIEGARSSQTYF